MQRIQIEHLQSSLSWAPFDLRTEVIRLAAEFMLLRPAVVHGWQDATGLAAALAGLIAGVPRLIIATRNVNPSNFDYFRPFMRPVYRRLSEEPNVVLTNNSSAGARDYEQWLGLDLGRFAVVRNGVDDMALRQLDPDIASKRRAVLGVPPDARVIGGIFRLQAEKRPLLWLQVARHVVDRMPQAHFVLYGSGTLEHRIRTMSRKLGIDDQLVMAGKTASVAQAMSLFDVLLLTSAQEGTPNVVLEASVLGVPVVATAVGGTAEAMRPGVTGFLVPCPVNAAVADDELARRLADAVIEALESEVLRRSVCREGPTFVRQVFGLERMIAEMRALYCRPTAGSSADS